MRNKNVYRTFFRSGRFSYGFYDLFGFFSDNITEMEKRMPCVYVDVVDPEQMDSNDFKCFCFFGT